MGLKENLKFIDSELLGVELLFFMYIKWIFTTLIHDFDFWPNLLL